MASVRLNFELILTFNYCIPLRQQAASLAQLGERCTEDAKVVCSIHTGSIFWAFR